MLKLLPVLLKTLTLCCLLAISGCGRVPELSDELVNHGGPQLGKNLSGFRIGGIEVGPWWVTMAEKGGKAEVVRIYIEGDGHAYVTASQPSGNPTPQKPIGLRLAKHDNAYESVIYLARPCQYANLNSQPCSADVWTSGRFDARVMDGYTAAISRLLNGAPVAENSAYAHINGAQVSAKRAVLIGYSGGAAIALEVAKRLPQVEGVITVAGNIDPAATNAWHGASEMPTAVRPYQYPGRLATLPVLHIVGSKDDVVPPGLTQQVISGAGKLSCTHIKVINGASHNVGWEKIWPIAIPRCD